MHASLIVIKATLQCVKISWYLCEIIVEVTVNSKFGLFLVVVEVTVSAGMCKFLLYLVVCKVTANVTICT